MNRAIALGMAGLLLSMDAGADWKDDVRDALELLSEAADQRAALTMMENLQDPAISDQAWFEFLDDVVPKREFTAQSGDFWRTAVSEGQLMQARIARIAAHAGALATAKALANLGTAEGASSARNGIILLQTLGPYFDRVAADAVLTTLEDNLAGRPGDLRSALLSGRPQQTALAIQICLTFAEYTTRDPVRRNRLEKLLTLPDRAASSWRTHGWFLFDRDALSDAHIRSLDSLAASVAPGLHRIVAVTVPEALGFAPAEAGFATTGQIIAIPAIPMTTMSNPSEFVPDLGQPVAPEFTLAAALEFFRAVEAVQFAQRPLLEALRNNTVRRAGDTKERYLRRFVPPGVYVSRPGELLPLSSYLYFIDTERTFRTAMELFEISSKPPMEAFLLMTDVFSGGTNQTLLFLTDPSGLVSSVATPISRTVFSQSDPVGMVSGIRIVGSWWRFQISIEGGAARYFRE